MNKFFIGGVYGLVTGVLLAPVGLFAQEGGTGIIPCNGVDCNFNDFVQLGINIVDFLVGFAVLGAVVGFIYAGFLILTAGANASQVTKGKSLLLKVGIGFFFVLAAWLIVNTITSVLFNAGFSMV